MKQNWAIQPYMQAFWIKKVNLDIFIYLGFILLILYSIFSLNSALQKFNKLNNKKNELKERQALLKEEIKKIKEEIDYIEKNPSYLLKIAMEDYFFVKPEDKLYIFYSKGGEEVKSLEEKERKSKRVAKRIKE